MSNSKKILQNGGTWDLIYAPEEDEYDVIPSKWRNDNKCAFPDPTVSKNELNNLVRNCGEPGDKWSQIDCQFIKEYDNFEDACIDMVRKTKKRRLASESADETAKKRTSSTPPIYGDFSNVIIPGKNSNTKKIPQPKKKESPKTSGSKNQESPKTLGPKNQESPKTSGPKNQESPKASGPKNQESPKTSGPQNQDSLKTSDPKRQQQQPDMKKQQQPRQCPVPQRDYHNCASAPTISLKSVASALCYASRAQEKNYSREERHHKEICSKLDEILKAVKDLKINNPETGSGPAAIPRRIISDSDVDPAVLEGFPILRTKVLKKIVRLLDEDSSFKDKVIATIVNEKITKAASFPTATARQVLAELISPQKAKLFSWDGKKRNGVSKIAFSKLPFKDIVYEATRYLHHPTVIPAGFLDFSLGQWFSQVSKKEENSSSQPSNATQIVDIEDSSADEETPDNNENIDEEDENLLGGNELENPIEEENETEKEMEEDKETVAENDEDERL